MSGTGPSSSSRRPSVPPPDGGVDGLLLTIGQLLESARSTGDALKAVSAELRENARAVVDVAKTLEKVEERVGELDAVVRGSSNAGNLVAVTRTQGLELDELRRNLDELRGLVADLDRAVARLNVDHGRLDTVRHTLWELGKLVGWVTTTVVAVYAAWSGRR